MTDGNPLLRGKVAIVTGASRAIGAAAVAAPPRLDSVHTGGRQVDAAPAV